ncbi:uncharacterized protein ARMOST_21290 [Armillaria ostoyae]|uniref:Uncharacterized protein n=1 Tax=Armillaria ostoyae TaxID=47428 RepID=A0A284S9R1_ARMOS|nr:uncharacterized protein ARMOST_21290 [Armillaria ostoyae]
MAVGAVLRVETRQDSSEGKRKGGHERAARELHVVVDASDKFSQSSGVGRYQVVLRHPSCFPPSWPLFRTYKSVLLCLSTTAHGTAVVNVGTGDIIAQQLIEKRGLRRHDFTRTVRSTFAIFGTTCRYTTRSLEGVSLVI